MADAELIVEENQVEEDPVQDIHATILHHIDIEAQQCNAVPISLANSDLDGYLRDLLREINGKEQKRYYSYAASTTEFFTCLSTLAVTKNFQSGPNGNSIANRLLRKEIETDASYGHLSQTGDSHVKKGSFLQFLFSESEQLTYLGVKIEHQSFLDEDDLKKKIGLSMENKIYKACKVVFDEAGVPQDALVFDTNSKPAVYWWRDFLELTEKRGDALNTRTASAEVVKVLNSIKRDFPSDHTILRNATIAAFKKDGVMKYDVFVQQTFANYVCDDPALSEKMPKLIDDLNKLPERKKFDTLFTLVPSEVMFKKTKINLTSEISISYEDGIENLESKIWSEKSSTGKKLVVIESAAGFDKFKLKPRVA